MNQSTVRPVPLRGQRRIPWAIVPPLLVLLLALGLWIWRNGGGAPHQGQRHLQAGRYQQAVESFSQAIAANPRDGSAYANRGLAYAGLKVYLKAIPYYT